MKTRREFVSHSLTLAAGMTVLGRATAGRAARGVPAYTVPLTMTDTRVAMSGTVNGQGPVLFVIDSGGQLSLMNKETADALGLPVARVAALRIGGRLESYRIRVAHDVVFAGQFRQPDAAFAETEHVRFGQGVVASVASGMLTSVDTELDFTAGELRFYPDGAAPKTGWMSYPNAIEAAAVNGLSPLIKVPLRLGGRNVRAIVDTGTPRGLVLDQKLFNAMPTGQHWAPAFKRGNLVGRAARLEGALNIGGLIIDRPVIAAKETAALFGSDVIIGLDVLRQLDLAVDAKGKTLSMRPNGMPAPPPRYNMSGIWVNRDGSGLVVGAIGAGSPAELAGMRVGDRIANLTFQSAIAALNGPAGQSVRLDLTRGSEHISTTLVLTDYL